MRTDRSFAVLWVTGAALLLAAIVFVLCFVPLVECGCCGDWDPVIRNRPIPACGWCGGRQKVSCWKHYQWRTRERLPLMGAD